MFSSRTDTKLGRNPKANPKEYSQVPQRQAPALKGKIFCEQGFVFFGWNEMLAKNLHHLAVSQESLNPPYKFAGFFSAFKLGKF